MSHPLAATCLAVAVGLAAASARAQAPTPPDPAPPPATAPVPEAGTPAPPLPPSPPPTATPTPVEVYDVEPARAGLAPGEDPPLDIFWPGLTIGLGGLVVASGVVTAIVAYNEYDSLDETCAPSCDARAVDDARVVAIAADVQIGVGAAVVAAGALMWWLGVDEGTPETATGATVGLAPSPGGLTLAGRF